MLKDGDFLIHKNANIKKCTEEGSNLQPPGSKPGTLSIELSVHIVKNPE